MNVHTKMRSTWCLLLGLTMFALSFMISSDSCAGGAAGGGSWTRHVYNESNETMVIRARAASGNVWFSGGQGTGENGPYTVGPGTTASMKYTTSGGRSSGRVFFYVSGDSNAGGSALYDNITGTDCPSFKASGGGGTHWVLHRPDGRYMVIDLNTPADCDMKIYKQDHKPPSHGK